MFAQPLYQLGQTVIDVEFPKAFSEELEQDAAAFFCFPNWSEVESGCSGEANHGICSGISDKDLARLDGHFVHARKNGLVDSAFKKWTRPFAIANYQHDVKFVGGAET